MGNRRREYGPDPEPTGRARTALLALVCPPGSVCHLCGAPIIYGLRPRHPLGPSMDHVIPRIKGGTWHRSNLRPAHYGCNAGRRDRDLPPVTRVRSRDW